MNIIITAGGTIERIDKVRSIANKSTGALSATIATEFKKQIPNANIIYICSVGAKQPNNATIIQIETIEELRIALQNNIKNATIIIHAMAVSDYKVQKIVDANTFYKLGKNAKALDKNKKLSSNDNIIMILEKNEKIISTIKKMNKEIFLVGFKLLVDVTDSELIDTGYKLLLANDCDLVVANDLKNIKDDSHIGFIIDKDKQTQKLNSKPLLAKALIKKILSDIAPLPHID